MMAVPPPMENDDLLYEILLRLSLLPSSLPRASFVCKRWRRLLSNPAFHRRFRIHHRKNPPLLGYFDGYSCFFHPTLEAPDHIPADHFSVQDDPFVLLRCRHGLALMVNEWWNHQMLVWDPVTAEQHYIVVPPGFDMTNAWIHGEVLLAAGDVDCFQVVLLVSEKHDKPHRRALACFYSSETGVWSDIISTPLASKEPKGKPGVLIGNCLYWMLDGNHNSLGILKFDIEKQRLDVIEVPLDMFAKKNSELWVMRAEGGGIGILFVSEPDLSIQLWKRKTDYDGIASWVLGKSIEIDKLLSMNPEEKGRLSVLVLAENNNVAFVWTVIGIFMVHLDRLQFTEVFKTNIYDRHPFESVYITGSPDSARVAHEPRRNLFAGSGELFASTCS